MALPSQSKGRSRRRTPRARLSERPRRAEAVIIGAGVIGFFVAYHLRKQGLRRIVVLDKGSIGGVASPRSAGILRHHYSHPLLIEMAIRGRRAYAAFARESGFDIGFTRNGYLIVVAERHSAKLEENVRKERALGLNVDLLTAEAVAKRFPHLRPLDRGTVAAYERDAAFVRPPAVIAALGHLLRAAGVELLDGEAVTHVETGGGRILGVQTTRGSWTTDVVVNCAGAWAAKVAHLAGVDLPVRVQRVLQIVEVALPSGVAETLPTTSHDPRELYARPESRSRILVGGRRPLDPGSDPDTVDLLADPALARRLRDAYAGMVTFPLSGPITHGWAGIDGDTPDYQPILGSVGAAEGFYAAVGFSGHGFKLAPVVGQVMSELVRGHRPRPLDVSALDLDRFREGRLFPPGYRQMGA